VQITHTPLGCPPEEGRKATVRDSPDTGPGDRAHLGRFVRRVLSVDRDQSSLFQRLL